MSGLWVFPWQFDKIMHFLSGTVNQFDAFFLNFEYVSITEKGMTFQNGMPNQAGERCPAFRPAKARLGKFGLYDGLMPLHFQQDFSFR